LLRRTAIAAVSIALLVAACGDDGESADATTTTAGVTTTAAPEPLTVLVTNDDGIGHPGIDTVVTALDAVDGLEVVVVAPAADRTGSSDTVTPGGASYADGTTVSGYPGTAVDGYPADTIAVAVDELGLEPDLVVSGINQGQNIGPLTYVSGTVGAARAAVRLGIPAIAGSAGLGDDTDYAAVADLIIDHIAEHRAEYADGTADATGVVSFNIPECTAGTIKDLVEVPLATVMPAGLNPFATDCSVDATEPPTDDVAAIAAGHATVSLVPPEDPSA
jgi:5'-nucleotidase